MASNNTSVTLGGWYRHMAEFMENKSDPRTKDWFMVQGFSPLFILLVLYNIFCTQIGPRLMRNRKPFELKRVLIVYNALCVLGSIYCFREGYVSSWHKYSFICEPVDYSNSPDALRMAATVHFYYMSKLIELLDTVFFVLRKKGNQITFLHLFHHTLMPIVGWFAARYVPGGHGTFLGMVNSVVHMVMYFYYIMAAMGPEYQKYLWWKKYLTMMQIIQFGMIFLHQIPQYIYTCDYPFVLVGLLTFLSSVFVYLFGSFYVQTYNKSKAQKTT